MNEDIHKHHILRYALTRVHTIEFQKQGLIHMHFLLFFEQNSKIRDLANIDRIICVEFSIKEEDPFLFETISTYMVHGLCGPQNIQALCMKDGICQKIYQEVTSMDTNGYFQYHRKNNRRTFNVCNNVIDNKDVVLYNPTLSRKYNCHINIEVCASIRAMKYIDKYIYKEYDCTTMQIGNEDDEVKQYIDAQYIRALNATWHLFGIKMYEEVPNMV